jgi:hypothetical protein
MVDAQVLCDRILLIDKAGGCSITWRRSARRSAMVLPKLWARTADRGRDAAAPATRLRTTARSGISSVTA